MSTLVTVDKANGKVTFTTSVSIPAASVNGRALSNAQRVGMAFQTAHDSFMEAWKRATIDNASLDAEVAALTQKNTDLKAQKISISLD